MVQVLTTVSLADMIAALGPVVGWDVVNTLAEYEIIALYGMTFNPSGTNVPTDNGGSGQNTGGGVTSPPVPSPPPAPVIPPVTPPPVMPVTPPPVTTDNSPATPPPPSGIPPVTPPPVTPDNSPATPPPVAPTPPPLQNITPIPPAPAASPALITSVLALNNSDPAFPSSDPNTISMALADIFPEVKTIPTLFAAQQKFSSTLQQYTDGRDSQIFSILQAQIDALAAQLNGITIVKG